MKHGYIFSSRRISWSDSPESIFADYDHEALSKDAYFKIKKIPAIRCEECRLVLFKHD
ncbi:PF20097 family protein [Bacillus mesophilum]|uniref:PF20097 family protein n=1 Tax=Bacillus mesophilum TaxID=1071718 RepID=UPI001F0024D2|nr:PF20097 family protein [Bacillus mesophilum]